MISGGVTQTHRNKNNITMPEWPIQLSICKSLGNIDSSFTS